MQRRKLSKVCLFSLLFATMGISLGTYRLEKILNDKSGEELVVSSLEGIQITSQKMATTENGLTTITVTYTLMPVSHDETHFNTYLEWGSGGTSGWGNNLLITDYLNYDLDETNQKIVFTCYQAFAQQIKFTMADVSNSKVSASLLIDYLYKELTPASASMTSESYQLNQALDFKLVYPTYSIGTKGSNALKTFTVEPSFASSSSKTMKDLIPTVQIPTGVYDKTDVWYNNTKMTTTQCREAMAEAVYSYLSSFIVLNGTETFNRSQLSSLLTFTYHAYNVGNWNDTTGTGSGIARKNLIYTFVDNYKTAVSSGTGVKATVKYDGKEVYSKILNFGFGANSVTEIVLGSTGIEF